MMWKATLAIALLVVRTVAPAQRSGTRIGRDAQIGNPDDTRRAIEIIADCLAARRPNLADRWLRLLPGSREERALLQAETEDLGLCMEDRQLILDNRELSFRTQSLRRPLALALVKRRLSGAPDASPLPRESDPWFMPLLVALPAGARIDRAALVVQDFGHCVVVHSWSAARALLRSAPESPEESAAMRRLTPHLGPCLTEGTTVEFTPTNLRNVIAEPFLHVMASTRATP